MSETPLPPPYRRFFIEHPELSATYQQLGEQLKAAGPLTAKEQALVKLGLSMGARLEGATHSHTRRAQDAGCSPEEIRHAAMLAMTTLGFPTMMMALTWIEDELKS
jgi:4-carboxymuconolactone decarboxylase